MAGMAVQCWIVNIWKITEEPPRDHFVFIDCPANILLPGAPPPFSETLQIRLT